MRRAAEILTTLLLFAIVMTAIGWAARGGIEWTFPWLLEHIGIAGIWAVLFVLLIIGGTAIYRSGKYAAGR
ncbi:hypothetical protein ACLBXB_25785 [Methylobacterium mesophilicum]